jgi:hypothetical protein
MGEIAAADLSAGPTQITCRHDEIGANARLDGVQEIGRFEPLS